MGAGGDDISGGQGRVFQVKGEVRPVRVEGASLKV